MVIRLKLFEQLFVPKGPLEGVCVVGLYMNFGYKLSQVVTEEKLFEIVTEGRMTDRWMTDDRACLYYKLSSSLLLR